MQDPRSIGRIARTGLISIWQSKGGGLYGLGYALTFLVLEILEIPEFVTDVSAMFVGDGNLLGSLIGLVVDFFVDTLVNAVYAFVWPALVLQAMGGYGVLLLGVGFAGFETFLRPLCERLLPELKTSGSTSVTDGDPESEPEPESESESEPKPKPEGRP